MMNNIKNKKSIIVIIIGLVFVIGFTFAYFTFATDIDNKFNSSYYKTSVNEIYQGPSSWAPGDTFERNVVAVNEGDVDVAVRVSFENRWILSNSNHVSQSDMSLRIYDAERNYYYMPNTYNDVDLAIVNFSDSSNWVKEGDYYYYKKKLSTDEETDTFISSITYNEEANAGYNSSCDGYDSEHSCTNILYSYQDTYYALLFKAEFVQYDVYRDVWGTNVEIN